MSSRQKHRVEVPDELKDVLVRFAIAYILEQPGDLIDYALTFFAKEREGRRATSVSSVESGSTTTIASTSACQRVMSPAGPGNRCNTSAAENVDADSGALVTFPKTDIQRARLYSALSQVPLFRCLDQQQMNNMLDAMREKTVRAKDYIVEQGADGANFYVIDSGVYECYLGDDRQHIRTFDNEGSFGEQGFLEDVPHYYPSAISIQAVQDGKLWAIDRQTFERVVQRAASRKRKAHEALLSAVPMLKTLKSHERAYLVDGLMPRTYARGDQLLLQDDAPDGLYFVEQGTVSIRIVEDADEVELARIETGGYFGELTLVTHWPQEASAWAVDDVRVAFLDAKAFLRLREPYLLGRLQGTSGDVHVQHVQVFDSQNNLIDLW